jgi:hypothetical protein
MTDEQSLPIRTYTSLIVEAGVNAIPVVGGSLATLYFGRQQEVRFAKLERFYKEMSEILKTVEMKIIGADKQSIESLAEIIDEINEAVLYDITEKRKEYLKHCFYNTLCSKIENQSDKYKYFIKTLGIITNQQLQTVSDLFKFPPGHGCKYMEDGQDVAHEFNASLESLKSYGFINATMHGTIRPGVNWGHITLFSLSEFGREFAKYCLNDN